MRAAPGDWDRAITGRSQLEDGLYKRDGTAAILVLDTTIENLRTDALSPPYACIVTHHVEVRRPKKPIPDELVEPSPENPLGMADGI